MGLFEKIFSKQAQTQKVEGYFKMLSAYQPVFYSYDGGVYEMELTRAAIHAFAANCSKLKPQILGELYQDLGKKIQTKINPYMDTTKFLYRLATILSVQNTAFIVPILDELEFVTGFYPILPTQCEVVEYQGREYLRYRFSNGQVAAVEFDRVGILTQFQYNSDFYGESNHALNGTMQLLNTQYQGIIEGLSRQQTFVSWQN